MDRPRHRGKHPLQTGFFTLPTPAIMALKDDLGYWMDAGTPGGCVVAPPGHGKTWGAQYFTAGRGPVPGIPVVYSLIPRDVRFSTGQFAEHLLASFGHQDPTSGSAIAKLSRIAPYLESLAKKGRGGASAIYIFVDDAQELEEEQLAWLANLYDTLLGRKVRACFVLFAEPRLLGRRDALISTNKNQIVRRLMTVEHFLPPILSDEDLEKYLALFDDGTEFPKKSGWSYSQYFLPDYFARGWRLAKEADRVFQAFSNVYENAEAKLAWGFSIPIQYLIAAVKYVLISNANDTSAFGGFTIAMWEEGVRFSGYIKAGRYLAQPEKIHNQKK